MNDSNVIAGLVPRTGICRVIITSSVDMAHEGFPCFDVNPWSVAEGLAFAWNFGLQLREDEFQPLHNALSGIPLALMQAVNYIRKHQISTQTYLDRLRTTPQVVLELPNVRAYSSSTLKAISISIEAAMERSPHCLDLLRCLSVANAAGPVYLRQFIGTEVVLVLEPRDADATSLVFEPHPETSDIVANLSVEANLLGAAEALSDWCLLKYLPDEHVSVHLLVGLVAATGSASPRPYIEAALSLFSAGEVLASDLEPRLEDIPHVCAILESAVSHDLWGAAIGVWWMKLAPILATIGDAETALRYSHEALSWVSTWEPSDTRAAALTLCQDGLITSLAMSHDYDSARTELEAVLDSPANDRLFICLRQSSFIANHCSTELAERAHSILEDGVDVDASRISVSLSIAQLDQALDRNEAAQERIRSLSDEFPLEQWSRGQLIAKHEIQRLIATDLSRPEDALRAIDEGLKEVKRDLHIGNELLTAHFLLSRSERLIDIREWMLAERSLDEVEALIERLPQRQTYVSAHAAGSRGRLLYARWASNHDNELATDTVAILWRAVELFRTLPQDEQEGLAAALLHLGQALAATGDDRAESVLLEAYELDYAKFGPLHPETLFDESVITEFRSGRLARRGDGRRRYRTSMRRVPIGEQ